MMKKENQYKKFISIVSAVLLAANAVGSVSAESCGDLFGNAENETANAAANDETVSFLPSSGLAFESTPDSEPLEGSVFYIQQYRDHVVISGYDKEAEITEIEFPAEINGLPVTEIGKKAFRDCTTLKSIKIADGITTIGSEAFKNCTELEISSLPECIKYIGSEAFYGCSKITDFTFHEGIVRMDSGSFGKTALTKVTLPSTLGLVDGGVFLHSPFYECSELTEVVFAENTTAIPANVLADVPSVTSVSYPDTVTSIGKEAFKGTSISEFKFPAGVTSIGMEAFCNCSLITEISLPEGLETMGTDAFYGTEITKVIVPSTLTTIEGGLIVYSPFRGCKQLTEVVFADGTTDIPAFMLREAEKVSAVSIPDTVMNIGNYAFTDTSLSDVILPAGLKLIGQKVFADCTLISDITLPEGLEVLGDSAFENTKLTTVTIPSTLTFIDGDLLIESPFQGCDKLTEVIFAEGTTAIPDYVLNEAEKVTTIILPETVVSIGNYAFKDTAVSEIKLPSGLKSIGRSAFCDCTLLTDIELPEGLEELGENSFENTKITRVTIPSTLTEISGVIFSDSPFEGCTTVTEVVFSEGMVTIPAHMLYGAQSVEKIVIPSTVMKLDKSAFRDCSSLKTVYGISSFDELEIREDALSGVDIENITFIPGDVQRPTATPAPSAVPTETAPTEAPSDVPSSVPSAVPSDTPSAAPSGSKGDVDGDGAVTTTDVRDILKYIVGKIGFNDTQTEAADMNSDGKVNSSDALLLLRTVTGQEK